MALTLQKLSQKRNDHHHLCCFLNHHFQVSWELLSLSLYFSLYYSCMRAIALRQKKSSVLKWNGQVMWIMWSVSHKWTFSLPTSLNRIFSLMRLKKAHHIHVNLMTRWSWFIPEWIHHHKSAIICGSTRRKKEREEKSWVQHCMHVK